MAVPTKSIGGIALHELARDPGGAITRGLCHGFRAGEASLKAIEDCFKTVTRNRGSIEDRRTFYRNWNMTNNSAMCVSGQANRLSALAPEVDGERSLLLLGTINALHRITDEDLAVGSGVQHAELFYRMATYFSESDRWLSHEYLLPEAEAFKNWRDRESLHHADLMRGLLITLVHEIYTHSEVEHILPLFKNWARRFFDLEGPQVSRKLAWISVHCQGTETRHFGHALEAVHCFAKYLGREITESEMFETVKEYLSRKANCMQAITAKYDEVNV